MNNAALNTQIPQRFGGEWETKQLKELGSFFKGRGIKRDDVSDEGLPCIRYGELYTRYQDYILDVASRIPPNVAATAVPIKTGDLLFAGSGETAEEIGRCAAYLGKEQAYAGGDVIVLTPSGQNSIYLGHLMNSPIVSAQKARLGQGDAVVHIYINNLAQVEIELPPITEQNAIAEVLSDVDGLLNALEALIAKKQAIKQATMQQLLTGKTRLPGFSGAWETKRVSEFGDVVTGATPSTKINTFWDGPYPWITPTDITSERDMTVSERMITQEGLNAIRTLPPNTVLVTCIASIGKNAILKTTGSCNQQINAVTPNSAHNAEFLYYLFEINSNFLLANAGITATNIVSKSAFSKLVFEVPLLDEQIAIASVLSDIDAEIIALEQRRDKTFAIKQGMMQQLLTGRVRLSESRIIADDTDDAD